MRRHEIYLRKRVSTAHNSTELARSPVENVVMKTIIGSSEPVKTEYPGLFRALNELTEYQPVF
jgi:hypothetical protein